MTHHPSIVGRIIDPYFAINDNGLQSAIAIDDNPHFWRSFYVGKTTGLLQRAGGPPVISQYDENWFLTTPDAPASDVLGGSIAAVTWRDNFRIFYAVGGSLVEVGLLWGADGIGWWKYLGKIL